jgi:triphosphoribosyl-dephospho-CoA synthase
MTASALRFDPLVSRAPAAGAFFDATLSTRIADRAVEALLAELSAWPKPGLVSYVDPGSHGDMDAALLEASTLSLQPFFAELAEAGQRRTSMGALRAIGMRAEATMLSVTGGVNTHRGAIFGLGLLCAAAGFQTTSQLTDSSLGSVVARKWGEAIQRGPIPLFSHGSTALRRYGAGGARAEAAAGFPSVYEVGLPALREGRRLRPTEAGAAVVQACFALIATVEDTNLLHRGGQAGARYAAQSARCFLLAGGVGPEDWRARAAAVHAAFVARRLSPGGCADLLAMTMFVDALESGVALQ